MGINKKQQSSLILTAKTVAILLLLLLLNVSFLRAVSKTRAFFSDQEAAHGNIYQAAVVDYSLNVGHNFQPALLPGQAATAEVQLANQSSVLSQYSLTAGEFSGDNGFCQILKLTAKKGGEVVYNGDLASFAYEEILATSTLAEDWQFIVSLPNADYQWWQKECRFKLNLTANQEPRPASQPGFSDQEKANLTVTSGAWGVALNEIMANPVGNDKAQAPGGEWVELYNNNLFSVDLSGWVLYDDNDGHELYITAANSFDSLGQATTTIGVHGWLVVYRNGDGDFSLNNDGDTVRLYNGEIGDGGELIDSYTYTVAKAEGYTYARIPDGVGAWVDPLPTPGQPNKLSGEDEILADLADKEQPTDEPADDMSGSDISGGDNNNAASTTDETSIASSSEPTTATSSDDDYGNDNNNNNDNDSSSVNDSSASGEAGDENVGNGDNAASSSPAASDNSMDNNSGDDNSSNDGESAIGESGSQPTASSSAAASSTEMGSASTSSQDNQGDENENVGDNSANISAENETGEQTGSSGSALANNDEPDTNDSGLAEDENDNSAATEENNSQDEAESGAGLAGEDNNQANGAPASADSGQTIEPETGALEAGSQSSDNNSDSHNQNSAGNNQGNNNQAEDGQNSASQPESGAGNTS